MTEKKGPVGAPESTPSNDGDPPPVLTDAVGTPTCEETRAKTDLWRQIAAQRKEGAASTATGGVAANATADQQIFGAFTARSQRPVSLKRSMGRVLISGLLIITVVLVVLWYREEIYSGAKRTAAWISAVMTSSEAPTAKKEHRQVGAAVLSASAAEAVQLAQVVSGFGPDGKPIAAAPAKVPAQASAASKAASGAKKTVVAASKPATPTKKKSVKVNAKTTTPAPSAATATAVAASKTEVSSAPREERFTSVKRYEQVFPDGKQKGWEHPNAAPCRGHKGCNTAWALGQSEWPMAVRAGVAHKIATQSPERMQIRKGDRFHFMAAANARGPWMDRNVVAAWSDDKRVEHASYWDYEIGDMLYRFVIPDICGNHSGQVFRIVYDKVPVAKPVLSTAPRLPIPELMTLGVLPIVACI